MIAPDFVVAGHPKCGSTTLQGYLNAHPSLCMGEQKEPSLYLDQWAVWSQGKYQYYSPNSEPLVKGDATVGYVKAGEVPERISQKNPQTKIIFLVRDPVSRALSHYHHWLRHGRDIRPLKQVIDAPPQHYFYKFGCYGDHLKEYLAVFEADQVEVLFFEDLIADSKQALEPIWNFLEVPVLESIPNTIWKNEGHGVKSRLLSKELKRWKEMPWRKRWIPSSLRYQGGKVIRALERANKSINKLEPTSAEIVKMEDFFRPQVRSLITFLREKKCRKDFPHWVEKYQ